MPTNSAPKRSIVWLHLSDLHICKPKTGWDSHRVLKPLREDLVEMQHKYGLRPDLVFFTGDAAFGNIGKGHGESIEDQFLEAAKFLEGVCSSFTPSIPKSNVFVVPGNHDIDRAMVTEDQTEWLDKQTSGDAVTKMIQSANRQWKLYMARLEAYAGFLAMNGYGHLLTDKSHLIYTAIREIAGLRVGVAGLNSAWSCGRNQEKGKLWMGGNWQLGTLTGQLDEVDVSIGLIHHPLNWFVEYEDPYLAREIERAFDFYLHGHEHQEWVDAKANGHTRIAAGACYETSDTKNGYNFVRLNLDAGKGEVWLRKYDRAGGGWIPCVTKGSTDNNGMWRLRQLEHLQKLAARGHWMMWLCASITDINLPRAQELVAELRQLCGYSDLELVDVTEGSVILLFLSTETAFARVQKMAHSGDLNEKLGYVVEEVKWIGQKGSNQTKTQSQVQPVSQLSQSTPPDLRDSIYISYSHRDRKWFELLRKELVPLCEQRGIPIWDDTQLKPGDDWRREMEVAQSQAKVAVFLVSSSSLASKSIAETELEELYGAASRGVLRLMWIPLSECAWQSSRFDRFVAAHPPHQPLETLPEADLTSALKTIARIIAEAAAPPEPPSKHPGEVIKTDKFIIVGGVQVPVRNSEKNAVTERGTSVGIPSVLVVGSCKSPQSGGELQSFKNAGRLLGGALATKYTIVAGSSDDNTIDFNVVAGAHGVPHAKLIILRPTHREEERALEAMLESCDVERRYIEGKWRDARPAQVDAADLIVAVGGGPGTSEVLDYAIEQGKPIVPLGAFGGAVRDRWNDLVPVMGQYRISIEHQEYLKAKFDVTTVVKIIDLILKPAMVESLRSKSMPAKVSIRNLVFISYSHQDKEWLTKLQKHLKPFVRSDSISYWDDTQIKPGTKWKDEIGKALSSAKVAVLLVSPDFLSSDFIANNELPPLLTAAETEGLAIIWVPISASAFQETNIADYQAARDPSQPLDSLSTAEQNKALVEICKSIKATLNP